jgi:hypothetical protein
MNVYFVMAPAAPIRGPKAAAAYPFFDLYPANAPIKVVDAHPLGYPYLQLYSAIAPSFVKRPGAPIAYPLFDLYPANAPIKVVDAHPFGYPYLQLYAAVVPSFVQRPGAPAAYPIFDLYPACIKSAGVKVLLAPLMYPRFDLYPAPAPAFGKTQIAITGVRVNYPKFDLYPEVMYFAPTSARRAVNVLLAPSVYPALVVCSYCMVALLHSKLTGVQTRPCSTRPTSSRSTARALTTTCTSRPAPRGCRSEVC